MDKNFPCSFKTWETYYASVKIAYHTFSHKSQWNLFKCDIVWNSSDKIILIELSSSQSSSDDLSQFLNWILYQIDDMA